MAQGRAEYPDHPFLIGATPLKQDIPRLLAVVAASHDPSERLEQQYV